MASIAPAMPSLLSRPSSSSSYGLLLSLPAAAPLRWSSLPELPRLMFSQTRRHLEHGRPGRDLPCIRAAIGEAPAAAAGTAPAAPDVIVSLKLKLLSAVAGLNKGLAADEEDLKAAESAAKELEAAGGVVNFSDCLDKLQGRWKLVYSSAFSSRTLGGSRPGPPTGRLLPVTLGKVFQRIDILSKDFDNIVELQFGTLWPLPVAEATATLAHKFELIGAAKIKITFVNTTLKPSGSFSQLPQLEIPRLPDGLSPPSNTGSGEFEVTYIDVDTRITRGDREELRVFVIS